MAQNLQLLKRRIKTAKNVSQIAKAMEMMSASKIKRAQTTVQNNKPYAKRIESLTGSLIQNTKKSTFKHPYIEDNKSPKKLLIAISPDRGLCGALNTNLFKALMVREDKNTMLITIGNKYERFASRLNFEFLASFPMGTTLPRYTIVYELVKLIDEQFKTGNVSSVEILYAEFVSFFDLKPKVQKILPINTEIIANNDELFHLFEPGPAKLLETLLPQYLEVSLYSALLEAYTSEQAARMVAMQNAKTNAQDIASFLTLTYNKFRQEKITNEILDLGNNS